MRIRKTLPTIVCAFMMACTIGMPAAYADDTAQSAEPTPAGVQVIDTPEPSGGQSELKRLPDLRAAATPTEDITVNPSLDRDEASISKLSIDQITDGTAPWDKDDERGDDSAPDNMSVRSFDKVTYNVRFVATSDDPMTYYQSAYVAFRVTLPYERQQASFDLGSIAWAEYDEAHKPTVVTNADGSQTLTCYRRLTATGSSPYAIPGTYTVPFAVQVKAMTEGETLQPVFEAWTVPNDVQGRVAKITPAPVGVTSMPKFDATLGQGAGGVQVTNGQAVWSFASSNGQGKFASDDMHSDKGSSKRILTEVAMSINMGNEDTSKGMRGLELPKAGSDLKYTVEVDNQFKQNGSGKLFDREAQSQPYFYAAHGQSRAAGYFQNPNRNHKDVWQIRDDYGYYPRPSAGNNAGNTINSGNVEVKETRKADRSVYEITVHDWQVDVDKLPTVNSGNATKCGNIYSDANCTVTTGVIAVAAMRVFTPTTIDGQDAAEHYNASLALIQNLKVTGLDITSATGQRVTEQTEPANNNKASVNQLLEPAGGFSMKSWYACATDSQPLWASGKDCAGWKGDVDWQGGTDSALQGDKNVVIQALSGYTATASIGSQGVLPMNLVTIDDRVIDVPEQDFEGYMGAWRVRDGAVAWAHVDPIVYYATKKDGTGWKNDDEQKKTLIDDLDYTADWGDARAKGVIVGVLIVSNSASTQTRNDQWVPPKLTVHVKDDATIVHVAQTTQHAQMWTRQDLINHGVDIAVDDTDGWNRWAQTIDPLQYRKTVTPTYNDQSWDGANRNYIKSSYDASGNYVPDQGNQHYGDSLTILGEKARISVTTDQKLPDGTADKGGKNMYDIDKEQRVIDWRVCGYTNIWPLDGTGKRTDWTITVTIPKGLTYIPGSSWLEGDYTEHTPQQGTVEGGTELMPDITAQKDGTTRLTYHVENVPISEEYHPIHLSTTIGDAFDPDNDVRNGDQFTLSASIMSTNDMSRPASANGKLKSYTVQAVRTKASSLATRADPLMAETDSDMDFVNMSVNASAQTATDQLTIGQPPRNGVNGSRFDGAYTVHGFDIHATGVPLGDNVEFYVSGDAKYAGIDPLTVDIGTVRREFTKIPTQSVNDTTMRVDTAGGVAAFAMIVRSMPANGRLDVRVDAVASGNTAGDTYINRYSDTDNTVTAISAVVSRSLDGTVWEDTDKNGARDDDEPLIGGVHVTLTKHGTGTVVASTITATDGTYRFDGLPAGDLDVRFDAPDDTDWTLFAATTTKADGIADTINSDATTIGKDDLRQGAVITGITMLALKDMTSSRYAAHNEDLGVIRIAQPKHTMPMTGDGRWLIILLAIATAAMTGGIILLAKGGRR